MKMFNPPAVLYLCDPQKNKNCKKTSCYLNHGECRCTGEREYSVVDENGKALGYSWKQFCELVFSEDGMPWPPSCAIDDILDTLEHNSSGLVDE